MSVTTESTNTEALGMSDEEWEKNSAQFLNEPAEEEETPTDAPAEAETDPLAADEDEPKGEAESHEAPAEGEGQSEDEDETGKEGDTGEEEQTDSTDTDDSGEEETLEEEETPVDYKAAYEKLTAPFRANGKEMQIDNVDDAVQLMKMGANYNKKMAAMKPALKMLKILENNNLLNEEKIGFLVDLDKKNPEAVTKLLKDSGIDPLELDLEKDSKYKAPNHTVDDLELELDSVLEEIKDTPSYDTTLKIVSNEWDSKSKQTVANNPGLLKVINDHVASGVYDVISTALEKERMLGRLDGKSDVEAYREVGDAIQAKGGFDHLFKKTEAPAPNEKVIPPKKPGTPPEIKDKRRAAGPTKSVASNSSPAKEFNPLAMSDEEYERQVNAKFL